MKLCNKYVLIGLLHLIVLVSCAKKAVNPFMSELPRATSDYGYTPENAIRMGYSKDGRINVAFCRYFIDNLTTETGQRFYTVSRASIDDPIHDAEQPSFLGMPKRGSVPSGGILDMYTLVTMDANDTIALYFDIYHKDSLRVPRGLIFVGVIDSVNAGK